MADGAGVHDEWLDVNSDDYLNPHTQSAPKFEAQGREYSDEYFDTANGSQDNALDYEDMAEDELEEALQELGGEEFGANGCYGEVNHDIYKADIEEFDKIEPELIPTTSLRPCQREWT